MVSKRVEITTAGRAGVAGQRARILVVKRKGEAKDIRWVKAEGGEIEIECSCGEGCACASGSCTCGCCEIEFVGSNEPEFSETEEDGEQVIRIRLPRIEAKDGGSDPLVRAAGVTGAIDDLEGQVGALVRAAREQGYSWTRIGDALGISKQAAWERFSGEE
ncbi:MAG: hypothetical protein ACLGH3_04550 [Actinomycetota bacterium]